MEKKIKLDKKFVEQCKKVTAKRPRTVIDHILKYGFITTQDLKDTYGYNHPPRAVRDVKEHGIPIEKYSIKGTDGRTIAAYKFGDPLQARFSELTGRTAFSKELKKRLIEKDGCRCAIYLEEFPERELQIDHRIPFEVAGDHRKGKETTEDYMLLSGSANRAKSWSCEHCLNWRELKKTEICRNCYWAFPDNYGHVSMRPVRRMDILWNEEEIKDYDKLKVRAQTIQKKMPAFVKEIIRKYVQNDT